MNTTTLIPIVALSLLTTVVPGGAAEGKGKRDKPESQPAEFKPGDSQNEPWVGITITAAEREVVRTYVKSFEAPPAKKGKKARSLPPGLQKKLDRGGSLPPGWEKKLVKSQVMPVEVYKECHPLPPELVVKLPPPPKGVITVTIEGKVVRLLEATREILDVFDVRLSAGLR